MGLFLEYVSRRELTEANAQIGTPSILSATKGPQGIIVRMSTPTGQMSSGILQDIRNTNQRDEQGKFIYTSRINGKAATVAMDTKTAQQVLPLFFQWKNSVGNQASQTVQQAQQTGALRGKPGGVRFILPDPAA